MVFNNEYVHGLGQNCGAHVEACCLDVPNCGAGMHCESTSPWAVEYIVDGGNLIGKLIGQQRCVNNLP